MEDPDASKMVGSTPEQATSASPQYDLLAVAADLAQSWRLLAAGFLVICVIAATWLFVGQKSSPTTHETYETQVILGMTPLDHQLLDPYLEFESMLNAAPEGSPASLRVEQLSSPDRTPILVRLAVLHDTATSAKETLDTLINRLVRASSGLDALAPSRNQKIEQIAARITRLENALSALDAALNKQSSPTQREPTMNIGVYLAAFSSATEAILTAEETITTLQNSSPHGVVVVQRPSEPRALVAAASTAQPLGRTLGLAAAAGVMLLVAFVIIRANLRRYFSTSEAKLRLADIRRRFGRSPSQGRP